MSEIKATERFSSRVANYVKYRPGYPASLVDRMLALGLLSANTTMADIGSGTGLSSAIFLEKGFTVYGVEPNAEMRAAGEDFLKEEKQFVSVSGTAEATRLEDHSIDCIIAGQAFHWFDLEKCKLEFKRILKPGGHVALIWNDRRHDSTDFLRAYEDLLKMFGTDYAKVNHRNIAEESFDAFFGKENWQTFTEYNFQDFTFEGLKGRLLSSSYVPDENHPDTPFMLSVLKKIFLRYQDSGTVKFEYDTRVFFGKI
jgi:SAM-dependent methyltransferase